LIDNNLSTKWEGKHYTGGDVLELALQQCCWNEGYAKYLISLSPEQVQARHAERAEGVRRVSSTSNREKYLRGKVGRKPPKHYSDAARVRMTAGSKANREFLWPFWSIEGYKKAGLNSNNTFGLLGLAIRLPQEWIDSSGRTKISPYFVKFSFGRNKDAT